MELSAQESAVLIYLKDRNEVNEREMRIEKLSSDNIRGAISWLEKKGLINVKIVDAEELELSGEGQKYLKEGLPELRVLSLLKKKKRISIKEIQGELGESESKIAIAQLAKLGIKPSKGELEYISGKEQEQIILREMGVLESIWKKDLSILPEYKDEKEALLRRSGIVERKVRSSRIVSINEAGRKNLAAMEESTDSIGELTAEMIRAGTWRDKRFRPYDLNLPGKSVKRRGLHPMTAIINDVRQIFLSMGFEELKDGYVEFAGWNMDSLFIPQDHPARDMQDTFFLEPAKQVEPDRAERILFGKSGKIHEKGMSGYSGWGYKWQPEEAEKLMLRTHTTASTMRSLHKSPGAEKAVFSVDKVFRHESVDWKHLAEFHQVEGAIHAKNANLGTLKWYLRKFYSALGFEHIELIPSYYPYTGPSLDVIVEIDGKELELGGSGLIRPEVTKALGLKYNVIAWGLGLERLALLYYGLNDLRKLYDNDMNWLQNYRIRL